MKRTIFLTMLFLMPLFNVNSYAQNRYKIATPSVRFFAGTPLEDIDATSDKLVGVIDVDNKTFAFRMIMNSFQFKRELMQEHYNENYLETVKYPNADFKGTIEGDFDLNKEGVYPVIANGILKVHNVPKEYSIQSNLTVKGDSLFLDATFSLLLEDHDIDRPKIVLMKIAEKADVTIKASLVKI